jgi:hypothetical protein
MQLAPLASTNKRKIESFLQEGEALMTEITLPSWTDTETGVDKNKMKTTNAPFSAAESRQAA